MKIRILVVILAICFAIGLSLGLFLPYDIFEQTTPLITPSPETPTPTAVTFTVSSLNRSELKTLVTYNASVKYDDIDYYYTDKTTADMLLQTIVQDLPEYKEATWDCDEIALYTKVEMARRYGINGVGFACGYYDGNRHAWNLILTDEGLQVFDAGFDQWGNESYQADYILF